MRLVLLAVTLARSGVSALSQGDTNSYLEPGLNLLLHGRFFADGVPDLVRPPGYPLFIAVTSLGGLPAAAAANVILSVLSVILVWRLGRTTFADGRVGLGAAWIFAFEPMSIALSFVLLSETLFLALFLLSMERLAEFLRGRRLPVLAVAGLALTAATFVRPVAYYLPIALAGGLFVLFARVPGLRWKAPAVLLISVLPWLAAWQLRNRIETGYSGFSSLKEVNLYFFSAVDITARLEHRPWLEVQRELGYTGFRNHSGQSYMYPNYLVLHPEQAGWSQGQRLAYMHSQAVAVIRAHYRTYLGLCLIDTFKTIVDPGTWYFDHALLVYQDVPGQNTTSFQDVGLVRWGTQFAKAHPWAAVEKVVFAIATFGLYLLAVRGIVCGGGRSACLWLMLGTSLYFFAVSAAAAAAESRYRLPVMPVVCIFAAAGFLRTKRPAPRNASALPQISWPENWHQDTLKFTFRAGGSCAIRYSSSKIEKYILVRRTNRLV